MNTGTTAAFGTERTPWTVCAYALKPNMLVNCQPFKRLCTFARKESKEANKEVMAAATPIAAVKYIILSIGPRTCWVSSFRIDRSVSGDVVDDADDADDGPSDPLSTSSKSI